MTHRKTKPCWTISGAGVANAEKVAPSSRPRSLRQSMAHGNESEGISVPTRKEVCEDGGTEGEGDGSRWKEGDQARQRKRGTRQRSGAGRQGGSGGRQRLKGPLTLPRAPAPRTGTGATARRRNGTPPGSRSAPVVLQEAAKSESRERSKVSRELNAASAAQRTRHGSTLFTLTTERVAARANTGTQHQVAQAGTRDEANGNDSRCGWVPRPSGARPCSECCLQTRNRRRVSRNKMLSAERASGQRQSMRQAARRSYIQSEPAARRSQTETYPRRRR